MDLRPMTAADLEGVGALLDDAFIAIIESLSGRSVGRPMFEVGELAQRLECHPDGCFVTVSKGRLSGALFSLVRGSLAWFGPVGVAPDSQRQGVGQRLVAQCLDHFRSRGARLIGLETFATSPYHLHLYSKFGFQPGWTGIEMRRSLDGVKPAAGIAGNGGDPESLDYLLPGLDVSAEAAVIRRRGSGKVLVAGDGIALLHLRDGLHTRGSNAFVAFLAAPDEASFENLLRAAEAESAAAGRSHLGIRLAGSSWKAFSKLTDLGYRPGPAMLRMKLGSDLDFDRDAWYCDDWL